jgi:hypothetical protein
MGRTPLARRVVVMAAPLLILAIAAVLRLDCLGCRSLWLDEVAGALEAFATYRLASSLFGRLAGAGFRLTDDQWSGWRVWHGLPPISARQIKSTG